MILTSSFPAAATDETCGYIRDFARSLSADFQVTVLAPPDRNDCARKTDDYTLARSRSLLPKAIAPFLASEDFNSLASRSFIVKLASLISFAAFFYKAARLARHADVLCSHWLVPSGLVGAAVARLSGKPHVAIEHSGALHLLTRMRGGKVIARFVARSSRRIITVSEDLKNKLVELCPEAKRRIEVVPMGISRIEISGRACPCSYRSHQSRKRTILFIGRLTEVKGVDVLLKAMRGIKGAQLIIAGNGEKRNELEQLARNLSVDAHFTGQVTAAERDRLLLLADMVVIPSRVLPCGRTEGMPVVCLEAMAAGRVVIASRAGGLAETIVDGHNGLLFETGDHLMLRSKIMRAMVDRELCEKISARAEQTAAMHCWSQIGASFSRILNDSLKKNDSIAYDQAYRAASAD